MLRAAFLGCALILPALFASAIPGRLDVGTENVVAENAQIPLGHDYRLICHGVLSRSISPAAQVFSPGAVFALHSELLPTAYVEPQTLLNSR